MASPGLLRELLFVGLFSAGFFVVEWLNYSISLHVPAHFRVVCQFAFFFAKKPPTEHRRQIQESREIEEQWRDNA